MAMLWINVNKKKRKLHILISVYTLLALVYVANAVAPQKQNFLRNRQTSQTWDNNGKTLVIGNKCENQANVLIGYSENGTSKNINVVVDSNNSTTILLPNTYVTTISAHIDNQDLLQEMCEKNYSGYERKEGKCTKFEALVSKMSSSIFLPCKRINNQKSAITMTNRTVGKSWSTERCPH